MMPRSELIAPPATAEELTVERDRESQRSSGMRLMTWRKWHFAINKLRIITLCE